MIKYLAIIGSVIAAKNDVPISGHLPGWQVGTKGADVQVNMFYDIVCKDAKETFY